MRTVVATACLFGLALSGLGQSRAVSQPPGIRHHLQRPREFAMPPLSAAERGKLQRTDIRERAGVHRGLPAEALAQGAWETAPDGARVWRAALRSPGSTGIRLEFRDFDVGAGQLWIYNREDVAGPYTGRGPWDDGRFWSATVFSESVVLEYQPAAGAALPAGAQLPFAVRTIAHQATAAGANASPAAAGSGDATTGAANPVPTIAAKDPAAGCHLDANCYEDWHDSMRMVAQIVFENDGGSYLCSATLVATRDNSLKPYLLTAGHCINNEAAARSLEVYWNYETKACFGTPPANRAESVRSTPGANLLSWTNMTQGDYSLLRLKDVPASAQFASWDLSDPPVNTPVTGVHHPSGSWKRISFGTRHKDATYEVEGSVAPGEYFLQVYWDKGRVEHGSSGSPLFSGPGVLAGVLSYGLFSPTLSVCEFDSFAGYGRFSKIYEQIHDYLENLPAAVVKPDKDLRFSSLNGAAPAAQRVRLLTDSSGTVQYKLRADAPWIKLSQISGPVSGAAPAAIDISLDMSKFDRPDQYQSTVTILSGAAEPRFINVVADIRVDRSNVVASVTANPAAGSPASPLYSFKIKLAEMAGVATRLTNVKINGDDFSGSVRDWFGDDAIPAKGALEASLSTDFRYAPGPQYFEFWGIDELTGRKWYAAATATF